MRFKGVIFDLDGTLINSEDLHRDAWNKLIESYGETPTPDWHEDTVGLPDDFATDKICRLFPKVGKGRDAGDGILEKKQEIYRQLVVEKGRDLAFPGVEGCIVRLKKAGIKLAVGTNSVRKNTEAALDAAELKQYFDALVTFDSVKRGKPAPDIYETAAAQIGLAPKECAVLEDSPAGLKAARDAGCAALALGTSMDESLLHPRDRLFPTTVAALDWILYIVEEGCC